jgi:hypothetical protein
MTRSKVWYCAEPTTQKAVHIRSEQATSVVLLKALPIPGPPAAFPVPKHIILASTRCPSLLSLLLHLVVDDI